MFAIIRTDGKQYRVAQGETIRLARISAEPGGAFETDQVLAIGGEESELKFGKPVIVGAKVKGTILQHGNCLLYTSDAADDMQCVDLGGRRIIKK